MNYLFVDRITIKKRIQKRAKNSVEMSIRIRTQRGDSARERTF